MANIQAIKMGNTVNVSIDGKLFKKNCGDVKEANELFKSVLEAKANPTDENIKNVRCLLSEKLRIALMAGIETDVETGEAFLAGFNTPIPLELMEVIKEYHENDFPLDPIINFWKLLMINPDTRVRKSLFNFITTHDFVLTDKGYMVVYKAVYHKEDKVETRFDEFISNQYLHIRKNWKCSANKYVAYRTIESDELAITKATTAKKWNAKEKGIEVLGKVGDLYEALVKKENDDLGTTYTDMYSRTMEINLGIPVVMPRTECNADPAIECSYGLHVGATKYVESYASRGSAILACFVNPANVVAVPNYDYSKMRVTEYFPFAVATFEDNKIDVIEQMYFEDDYINYEIDELEAQVAKIQAEELPYETAKNAEKESRPMSELKKMIEERIFDIE